MDERGLCQGVSQFVNRWQGVIEDRSASLPAQEAMDEAACCSELSTSFFAKAANCVLGTLPRCTGKKGLRYMKITGRYNKVRTNPERIHHRLRRLASLLAVGFFDDYPQGGLFLVVRASNGRGPCARTHGHFPDRFAAEHWSIPMSKRTYKH